jgi:hypothetical protein
MTAKVTRVTGIGAIFFRANDPVEYGKFGWVIDREGNKVELWQPHVGQ